MIGDAAESSSQALERYVSEKLAAMSLIVSSDDVRTLSTKGRRWADSERVEYMARFIEEEGLEREEKVEGVRGMLEGVVEGVNQDGRHKTRLRVSSSSVGRTAFGGRGRGARKGCGRVGTPPR
jgi:adenosine deaminase